MADDQPRRTIARRPRQVRDLLYGIAALLVLVVVVSVGWSVAEAWQWVSFDDWDDPVMTTLPPAAEEPPRDAELATSRIVELYEQVFTPGGAVEDWRRLFTDPDAVTPVVERFRSSPCAVAVQVEVTLVRFVDDDHAVVQFRFAGPNVPDIDPPVVFTGAAERGEDDRWHATPDGVLDVARASSSYC